MRDADARVDCTAAVNGVEAAATCQLARLAIRALRPDLKEILSLRLNCGLDYEEIARMTGCPVESVKMEMRSAVRELRKVLNEG
jgi:DNA-directed RNA polymerase specialized sigma24 family protein